MHFVMFCILSFYGRLSISVFSCNLNSVSSRQPTGTQEELLVFIWTEGPLEFIDASDSLLPFSEYEYRVTAVNSKGSASSFWTSVRTLEAEPQGMDAPLAHPTSAYSLLLSWSEPNMPNGVISKYKVVYQKLPNDPTFNSTTVTALTVLVILFSLISSVCCPIHCVRSYKWTMCKEARRLSNDPWNSTHKIYEKKKHIQLLNTNSWSHFVTKKWGRLWQWQLSSLL